MSNQRCALRLRASWARASPPRRMTSLSSVSLTSICASSEGERLTSLHLSVLIITTPCIREVMRLARTAPGCSRTVICDVAVPGMSNVVAKEGTSVMLGIAVRKWRVYLYYSVATLVAFT